MKISPRDVDQLLRQPNPTYLIYLLYGPDIGLARVRAQKLAGLFCENLDDPFAITQLSGADLREDKTRLSDEANALNIFGGLRLVTLTGEGTELTQSVKIALEKPNPEARIIIRATDVNTRHALVRLCESSDICACIGCYPDDSQNLAQLARNIFARDNIRVSAEAMALLTSRLGSDHQASISELEKLALYSGPDSDLQPSDIEVALGDGGAVALDELAIAVLSGKVAEFEMNYARLRREGTQPISVIRQLLGLMRIMLNIRYRMKGGENISQAIGQQRPPVHFRMKPILSRQAQKWPIQHIKETIEKLVSTEIQIKSAGHLDPATITGQILLGLCLRARQLNR